MPNAADKEDSFDQLVGGYQLIQINIIKVLSTGKLSRETEKELMRVADECQYFINLSGKLQ